ncbi:hypothetical protein FQN57_005724 [Myotisia sp. PD_48]|nr:hypothetical protein FQN57_005724 [Myotisia sp. PD_48]
MATDPPAEAQIYTATYSNVPVYEYKVGTDNVMRRRIDDWVNATHILKVAGLDKPSRTRILEREVQRGVHEKIQGGYGKYQGTWIPLKEARALADKSGVLGKLSILLDYVAGDVSPPRAPKHTTASSRPRQPKATAANRRLAAGAGSRAAFTPVTQHMPAPASVIASEEPSFSQDQYPPNNSQAGHSFRENSVLQRSPAASSFIAEDELTHLSPQSVQSRKRKRGLNDVSMVIEQNHILYGDQLLDYFMTVGDAPNAAKVLPPIPPAQFQVDRPIDDLGNTALHWACAMGDLDIVKDLINRNADVRVRSHHDETPLVRAVLFTNNYEKRTMGELADLLQSTVGFRDWFGATVFNHLAATTKSKGKWKSSRYYCQVLMDKIAQIYPPHEISLLLSSQDANGDTAALAAAKNGCYRLATMLLAQCPEAGDLQNRHGETANEVLMTLYRRRKDHPAPPSSVTQASIHEGDIAPSSTPPRCSEVAEATAALLDRVGSIMAEANRRLARAYGEVRSPILGAEDARNPKALYEQLESDRRNIRAQISSLSSKEEESEDYDELLVRYNSIRLEYESLLEQQQAAELRALFQEHGCLEEANNISTDDKNNIDNVSDLEPTASASDSVSVSESAVITTTTPNGSTAASGPSHDLDEVYELARQLAQAQAERQATLRELIRQQADAGVSAKLDVHRKLVALATGLPEDELDPMSSELADALEFDRANEKRPTRPAPIPSTVATIESSLESPSSLGPGLNSLLSSRELATADHDINNDRHLNESPPISV